MIWRTGQFEFPFPGSLISTFLVQVDWSTTITPLSEPIDIFCEWIDECEKVLYC